MAEFQLVPKSVFISYRRTNIPWALNIFQYLTNHGYDVFFDYEGIGAGDFEQIILGNILSRAHFLIVLTPSALERCGQEGDWLRREIETAIENKRNIVPLMIEGFSFGTPTIAAQLTGKLTALKHYNGIGMPAEYFFAAMEKLRTKFLDKAPEVVLHPVTAAAEQAATEQTTAAAAAPPVQEKELTAQEYFERAYSAAHDLDEKIRLYSQALQLDPNFAQAHYERALALKAKGGLEAVMRGYDDAIERNPDAAVGYRMRAVALSAKGDLDNAIRDCNQAIRLQPDGAEAYNNRGNIQSDKGDLEAAIHDYDQAILLKPGYAGAYNNRGFAHVRMGDLDAAILDFEQAIRLKPDYAEAYNNRGTAHFDKGDLEAAIRDYDQAIRLQPDFAVAYNNRGDAHKNKGDLGTAILSYEQAIRIQPDYANAYFNRADLLERADPTQAIADFQRYLDLGGGTRDGDTEIVQKRIEKLKAQLP